MTVQTEEAAGNIPVYSVAGSQVTRVKVTTAATRVELAEYAGGMYFMYFENKGVVQLIGKVVLTKE